jgi:hypothetical protein
VIGTAAGSVRRDVQHQTAPPATVTVASAAPSPLQTVGEAGGFLAVLALLGGSLLLWRRHTKVGDMRSAAARVSDHLVALEGQLARVAGGRPMPAAAAAGAGAGVAVGGHSGRAVYRQGGSASTFALAALVAFVLAGGGVVVAVATGAARPRPHPKAAVSPVSVPVVVLNAGTTQGAAGKLARSLRARHIDVLGAANLNSPAPEGYEVLYTVGSHAQAELLAHVLQADSPLVAPADPAAQAAAGPRAKLIVVIP